MAKKAGAQQLQAEINSDDDFEKFLDKYPTALLVLDVYSEWCGPCLGTINALRKIKLELGGDRLQLAICKSDYITKLQRFRKRSEPTWLFLREGRSINLMFGSDVPKLMHLITHELELMDEPVSKRTNYAIEDLHPEEQRRLRVKLDAIAAIERKERIAKEKKWRKYLMYCTDAILDNLPDVGVSVFGPQVNRDMFKQLNAPAEALGMACKDKRYQTVTKEDFDVVNFACPNPLPDEIIDILTRNDIFMCFWKVGDESGHSVPWVMNAYANELTKKVVEPPDEYNPEGNVIPPIISPAKIKVEYEVEDYFVCPPDEDDEVKVKDTPAVVVGTDEDILDEEEDMGEEEGGEGAAAAADAAPVAVMDMPDMAFDMGGDVGGSDEGVEETEEAEEVDAEPPPKKTCTKTVKVPPIWVPSDERTHAALIYVFFRTQTFPFLPPDPPPDPPHVVMAFDTYKKRDLIAIAERNKKDIPYYGFFSSDEAEDAKFIANSAQKYVHFPQNPNDKLVFRVNKHTSHMMLSLATYGATYVSPNPQIGREEALKFFPEGYRTAEQDRLEALEAQKEEDKKQGKTTPAEEPPDDADIDYDDGEVVQQSEMGEGEADGDAEAEDLAGEGEEEEEPEPATEGEATAAVEERD